MTPDMTKAVPTELWDLSLAQAARDPRVNVNPATVFRWSTIGVRGQVLETRLIGGRRRTSAAALSRFLAKLNSQPGPTATDVAGSTHAVERAEAEAAAMGL